MRIPCHRTPIHVRRAPLLYPEEADARAAPSLSRRSRSPPPSPPPHAAPHAPTSTEQRRVQVLHPLWTHKTLLPTRGIGTSETGHGQRAPPSPLVMADVLQNGRQRDQLLRRDVPVPLVPFGRLVRTLLLVRPHQIFARGGRGGAPQGRPGRGARTHDRRDPTRTEGIGSATASAPTTSTPASASASAGGGGGIPGAFCTAAAFPRTMRRGRRVGTALRTTAEQSRNGCAHQPHPNQNAGHTLRPHENPRRAERAAVGIPETGATGPPANAVDHPPTALG